MMTNRSVSQICTQDLNATVRFYLVITCVFLCASVNAQLPDTIKICRGEEITLTAPTGYTAFKWTPFDQVGFAFDNSVSFQPNQSGTIFLEANLPLGANRVTNGSLNDTTGFTSDYSLTTTGNENGDYGLVGNPQDFNPSFGRCRDINQIPGPNFMLVAIGLGTESKKIYKTSVQVEQNKNYVVSFWGTQLSENPTTLKVTLNGIQRGPLLNLNFTNCTWQQYFYVWNSGSSNRLVLEVSDLNGFEGIPFAIDGFVTAEQFAPYIDSTYIEFLNSDTISVDTLLCYGQQYTDNNLTLEIGESGYYPDSTTTLCPVWNEINVLQGWESRTDTILACADSIFVGNNTSLLLDTTIIETQQNLTGCTDTLKKYYEIFDQSNLLQSSSFEDCTTTLQSLNISASLFQIDSIKWRDSTLTSSRRNNLTPGSYPHQVFTSQGCSIVDTAFLTNSTSRVLALAAGYQNCRPPKPIYTDVLFNTNANIDSWSFSHDGDPLNEDTFEEGIIQFNYIDAQGCSFDTSLFVFTPESEALQIVKTNEGINSVTYSAIAFEESVAVTWIYEGTPQTQPSTSLQIDRETQGWLIAEYLSSSGCITKDSLYLKPTQPERIYFPNAFSPNGDGVNDVFTVGQLNDIKEIKDFKIYDRWGNLVFTIQNCPTNGLGLTCGWDGTTKGKKASLGVYYFVATILSANDFLIDIRNSFTLMSSD